MIKIQFFQVDAFSNQRFKGNPAGVCLLYEELPVETMQAIAFENNLSETAFLVKNAEGFNLRWFTPTIEVDLCGHATLASAHILWQSGLVHESSTLKFYTRSGILIAKKQDDWIELDFPASFEEARTLPDEAIDALGIKPLNSVFSETRYIVELNSEKEILDCKPDFGVLSGFDMIVITSRADAGSTYDFVSRTFGPSHGVNEDPVTGSSHCCLAPYWTKRLGREEMFAYQASERGGAVRVRLNGDRVFFSGQAVTVIEGFFLLG